MKIQDEDHFIQLPNLEMFEAQYKKKIYIHNLKSTKSLFMVLWTYFDHLFIARPISISHLTRCRFRGRHQITPIRSDSIPRRAISHPRILADSWPYKPHRSLCTELSWPWIMDHIKRFLLFLTAHWVRFGLQIINKLGSNMVGELNGQGGHGR